MHEILFNPLLRQNLFSYKFSIYEKEELQND